MRQYSKASEAFVNLLIATSVLSSWASSCLIIWRLYKWHWPLWAATIVGIPLGLLTTCVVFLGTLSVCFAVGRFKNLLNPKRKGADRGSKFWADCNNYIEKQSEEQPGGLSLLDHIIMPTLISVILTIVLVPVFVKARAKARIEANQGYHVLMHNNR